MKNSTILVPKMVFEYLSMASSLFARAKDHLEDFALLKNKSFVEKVKKARTAEKKGKFSSWDALKARYGV